MYYYGNPHLDPILSNDDLIQDAAKAALAASVGKDFGGLVDHRPGDQHTSKALQRLETDSRLGGNLSDRKRYQLLKRISDAEFKTIAADAGTRQDALRATRPKGYGFRPFGGGGLFGLGLLMTPTDAGDSRSDFGYADRLIQDRAQKKGLEGRRLYPYKRGSSPVSGRKYGSESKGRVPKRESAYQRERRKRREEEEKKRREGIMGLNRMRIGAISRPSIVPKPVWDSYVGPDGGNFGRYDDIGRFIGLDTDALYESLGIKALMEAKIDPRYSEFIGLDTIDLGPITEG